jgi:hypothetical protein
VELTRPESNRPVAAVSPPDGDQVTVGAELLDAIVGAVGHVDVAAQVDRDAVRGLELARRPPLDAPCADELEARR